MFVECCGAKYATNFCPTCGKQLANGALVSLLSHVKNNLKQHAKHYENYIDYWKDREGGSGERGSRLKETLDKWQNWYDALREQVEQQSK